MLQHFFQAAWSQTTTGLGLPALSVMPEEAGPAPMAGALMPMATTAVVSAMWMLRVMFMAAQPDGARELTRAGVDPVLGGRTPTRRPVRADNVAAMTAPEEITVHANGLRYGALSWGDAGAPLALLLHGYPDTAHTWRHVGPLLAEAGWRAVAPFTRGYAPTDLAPDDRYFLADLVDDVLALHEALDGDDRAVLIGHDWGAVTVWGVTERAPTPFAAHVAMSVPPAGALLRPFASLRTAPLGLRQLPRSWYFVFNQFPVEERGFEWSVRRLWRTWSPGYDGSPEVARVLAALHSHERRRAALRYYRDNLVRGAVKLFGVTPKAPALLLHGSEDGCILPELGEAYPRFAPGTVVERVEGAGHFLPLEAPDRVAARVLQWIGPPHAA